MAVNGLPGLKYLVKKNGMTYLVIIVLIFGVGTAFSIINWRDSVKRSNDTLITRYQQELNQSKQVITQSLGQYSLLLDDGTSLLAVDNNSVTQSQWLKFFESYDLTHNYPGVDTVSFSQYVTSAELPGYLSNLASQGQPSFIITPAGSRSVYTPVTYIGYISPTSLQAMGYDQLSNSVRASAINSALNSGMVTMSGVVNLVAVRTNQPAFLIYKPVYNGSANTITQRQASIYGFVFIAVNSNDFFNSLLSRYIGPGIAVKVYDSNIKNSSLLYATPDYSVKVKKISSPITSYVNVNFGGRTWKIKIVIAKSIIKSGAAQSSILNLMLGIVLSALVASVLWYFTYYRERKIYWEQQIEVQSAKDELLSLASHQLRTPATIVKQYLGILLQNYGGKITEEQRNIIKTAYDSNERQLEIANQFLSAARIGSGRITLNKESMVLNDVISQVVAEQQEIAKQNQQKIIFNNPKRAYKIKGDTKYLPMVFENLISNAIKYSKKRTKIDVTLRKSGNFILVSVSDKGMGISAEEQAAVFEKFTRASNERNADGNGTGIGLYLAKQVVNLHRGDISVQSTLGKGSTFTVRLPIKENKSD